MSNAPPWLAPTDQSLLVKSKSVSVLVVAEAISREPSINNLKVEVA